MFEQLQKFLHNFSAEESAEFSRDDPRVAAAALFFHVVDADGVVEPVEIEKVKELLERPAILIMGLNLFREFPPGFF